MTQKTIDRKSTNIDEADPEFVGLISAIYDAAISDGSWPEILQRTCAKLDGDAAALIGYDISSKSGRIHYSFGLKADFAQSYNDRFGGQDVWLRRSILSCRPGQIQAGEQVVAESILVASDFQRHWLAPQDLFYAQWGTLLVLDDTVMVLSLYRSEGNGPFGKTRLARFGELMPHLQRAFRINELLSRAQLEGESTLGALDQLPNGVILLDANSRVIETNRYANEILSMNDGLRITREGLQAASRQQTERIRQIVQRGTGSDHGIRNEGAADGENRASETILIARPSGQSSFNALISPLPVGARFLGELHRAVAIFITDPERQYNLSHRRLREIYELTPAEARMASLVAQGNRLEDAAEDLGVSLNTVRTHLKRIFAKTGTDRQADLVRLILSGPAQILAD